MQNFKNLFSSFFKVHKFIKFKCPIFTKFYLICSNSVSLMFKDSIQVKKIKIKKKVALDWLHSETKILDETLKLNLGCRG